MLTRLNSVTDYKSAIFYASRAIAKLQISGGPRNYLHFVYWPLANIKQTRLISKICEIREIDLRKVFDPSLKQKLKTN